MKNLLASYCMDTQQWIDKAIQCLNRDNDKVMNEARASACVNMAMFSLSQAKREHEKNPILPEVFEPFFNHVDVVSREIILNFQSNHSHQWSLIEYDRLKESYRQLEL